MANNNIFYYPYASFTDEQAPLLKSAALYFDRLTILDPVKASWDSIGPGPVVAELKLLEAEGILERIAPEDVLGRFDAAIAAAIQADLADPDFLKLCEQYGQGRLWTLALAKVPKAIRDDPQFQPLDNAMRRVLREAPHSALGEPRFAETFGPYVEGFGVYDEYREAGQDLVEYRYADYPLAVGEAIMLNHALFGSLLHTQATPLADDPFHNRVLDFKFRRAANYPAVRQVLEDRARERRLKQDQLALKTIMDVDLAILSPELPLEAILEYRRQNQAALEAAREELGLIARQVRFQPWSQEFADELEHVTLPAIQRKLRESRQARDGWLSSERGKNILKATGLAIGAAATTVTLVTSATPLLPVAVVTTALGLVSSTVIPGLELALDWKKGKQEAMENGLHYLLKVKV